MNAEPLPDFSVAELNAAIGTLLDRGFAPRFLVHASVSQAQLKKGHLWLTLSDGEATISAVVWSSRVKQLSYRPIEGDGVVVVGKLNFWAARATLSVQVLDIRPTLSTVLRQFEVSKTLLLQEGLIDSNRRRVLPKFPSSLAILTSVPSSALADMLRTAQDRWPLTRLCLVPIPVQGDVAKQIQSVFNNLLKRYEELGVEAIVIARGGGSREDLVVFDDPNLCRTIASCPIPVVTGIGHEDDLTVLDLVADYRAATPTAAITAILPNKEAIRVQLLQRLARFSDHCHWLIGREQQHLKDRLLLWQEQAPLNTLNRKQVLLDQKSQLLEANSPSRWLKRGFAIVRNDVGNAIKDVHDISPKEMLNIQLSNGSVDARTELIHSERSVQ
ncbi:exodeoxyribonuclease VII large subunit [Prochlorococcus sp. MIT 1300]|uniref:exodeoxyribonuclease VII large subunit n=1 Tax=Prochlorococcus sp. MIT 1300 TaxID=3096218 RepID=UPI002A747E26|nr:exodeoxyribonuclease VII large subunit [Prochlorococcus sp. MIT 1300]